MDSTRKTTQPTQVTSLPEQKLLTQIANLSSYLDDVERDVQDCRNGLRTLLFQSIDLNYDYFEGNLTKEEWMVENKEFEVDEDLIRKEMIELNERTSTIEAEMRALKNQLHRTRQDKVISLQDYLLAEATLHHISRESDEAWVELYAAWADELEAEKAPYKTRMAEHIATYGPLPAETSEPTSQ